MVARHRQERAAEEFPHQLNTVVHVSSSDVGHHVLESAGKGKTRTLPFYCVVKIHVEKSIKLTVILR